MPIHADSSTNIKFPLPEVKPAFMEENVFPPEMFERIKKRIKEIPWGPNSEYFYHTSMGRWESGINFDPDIEEFMLQKGRDLFGNQELRKTYWYTVRYQKQNGNIPHLHKHMDQNGCEQTIDICIEQEGINWGIEVDGVSFPEKENAAVCFYGQQQVHSRPEFPKDATEDNWLTVLFLHFTRPEHWWIESYDRGGMEEVQKSFGKYGSDGDIRYYEYTGEVSHPVLPEGQEMCKCHDYSRVPLVIEEVIGRKI